MIAQRAVYVPVNEDETDIKYFEYGAVLYPEGLVDGQLVYFNSEDVYKVIAVGYTDADDELLVEEINEALEKVENEPKKSLRLQKILQVQSILSVVCLRNLIKENN